MRALRTTTIRTRLTLGFSAVALVVAALAGVGAAGLSAQQEASAAVTRAQELADRAADARFQAADLRAGVSRFTY